MLASEKLEDLNQRNSNDALLTAGGSLGADSPGFFDLVQTSSTNGLVIDQAVSNTPLAATGDLIKFKRRWVIEGNTPAPLVRRITVIVIPQTGTAVEQGETFQTSMVRPCAAAGC
jgi:hypothetical protein